jgi:hypothetical protein
LAEGHIHWESPFVFEYGFQPMRAVGFGNPGATLHFAPGNYKYGLRPTKATKIAQLQNVRLAGVFSIFPRGQTLLTIRTVSVAEFSDKTPLSTGLLTPAARLAKQIAQLQNFHLTEIFIC